MMHIPDGILSAPVLVGGAVAAAAGVGLALRRIDERAIPRVAILAAVFFAGSLIAVPVGPSSVHLVFGGLMGVMLGLGIFPAVLVALVLQAVLFGFGGLTTLGVNTFNIALPGALLGGLLGPMIRRASPPGAAALAAVAGAGSVVGNGVLVALTLRLSSPDYAPVASVVVATYLPLVLVEGAITAFAAGFLARVKPDALSPQLT
ncbi:cobalt transporter CbiM [Acuticoccus yangtzensis]|uniref:cobalt transporter CbiM n=1 Tax=Acuticoccus yangtzensis TaxID=1443441 RepID=UPI0009496E1C|nr:cobalt transporter CbiM [Acuticoccus yangtzensis]